MSSLEWSPLLDLYQRLVRAEDISVATAEEPKSKSKRGVYTLRVVLWLMILQRLHARGTLACAVQLLQQGAADPLLAPCQRVRQKKISSRTGGYCQARQKLSPLRCREMNQQIVEQVRVMLNQSAPAGRGNVFIVDGSSIELEHARELVKRYPPASNQHGDSHWPILRLVVMHDAETGLAAQISWGPMNGPHAVSEQGLAEKAMESLPAGAVIVGDRNFGIFSLVYAAQQGNHPIIVRLTDVRARKLVGPISQPGEYPVVWGASRWDGGNQPNWPAGANVRGRIIAVRVGRGKSKHWLYLFTTLAGSVKEIVELYGLRWNIETDLRSLKRTVRLQHINAKSDEMMEKELQVAMSAYNLVRAIQCLAARRQGIEPRRLSFSHVLTVLEAAWPKLTAPQTKEDHDEVLVRVLDLAAQGTLPRRKKRRSYPRLQWRRGGPTNFRKNGEN